MTSLERLNKLCNEAMQHREFESGYKLRLQAELKEIEAQNEADYFLLLYDKHIRYAENQNNLLVPYLLGIVKDFDVNKQPIYIYGDWPDVDVDYIPQVRDYLKNVWAPKEYGQDRVCNIGSYNTFGIKSTLQNMARVFGLNRGEIVDITKQLELKDDEGKLLTWDKALELYPILKEYCEKDAEHADVADAVKKLLNRNNNIGKHAGGLIISSVPIDNFVPLVKDKDGMPASAWVEGLHGQDLGPMGLVKFDLLVITNLVQIAKACKLIKERHGLEYICALPGQKDWSDTSYLNDPLSLKMASNGDLKCIFQFDSTGIRQMAKDGGVDSFDDLVAYTSLYRPGPLGQKMQERYIERKRGRENYEIHPLLKSILGVTYNVLVYQEQVMQVLHIVGGIPLKDCEIVRKAISKKKVELFSKYKEMFVINGQKNLGQSENQLNTLWSQIESFAEYGFNKSVLNTTLILTKTCGKFVAKKIEDFIPGDIVLCVNKDGITVETEVLALHDHGILYGYEVTFDDGHKVICTMDHKFLTIDGQKSLREIIGGNYYILCDPNIGNYYVKEKFGRLESEMWRDFADEERYVFSSKSMPILPRKIIYDGEMGSQMWQDIQDARFGETTSARVQGLSQVGMEDGDCGWTASGGAECGSMWFSVGDISSKRAASEGMSRLSAIKARTHTCQEFKIESIGGTAESLVCGGEKNFCSFRNSASQDRTVASLEGSKSREVCQMYRGNVKIISETFQNGTLAWTATRLGASEGSVWQQTEAGGFCKRQSLDRGGRVLSFPQKSAQKGANSCRRTGQGCYVESRSDQKEGYNPDSSRHGMFCFLDRGDETRMVGHISEHAPIADTGNLVSRKIVRVVPVGRQHMYDLEVACLTHNFLLSNGIVTSNSHACAYTYISSRLLWLKSHYPLEFYTAILSCEGNQDKLKEYKQEAERHSIKVMPVDINKSGVKFQIVDDVIYFGLSNVKGVGDAVAQRIVDNQPYENFADFLEKFGTEATVVKPLLGLRVFKEDHPINLWKFYEWYKSNKKRKGDFHKRFEKRCEELTKSLREHLPLKWQDLAVFTLDALDEVRRRFHNNEFDGVDNNAGGSLLDDIELIHDQYNRSVGNYHKKLGNAEVFLKPYKPEEIEVDEKIADAYSSVEKSEMAFYGFLWTHPLEKSHDYEGGMTFEDHRINNKQVNPVECLIKEVEEKTSKKSSMKYWLLKLEDANSEVAEAQVWKTDWERFSEELQKGVLARLSLKAPTGGFHRYTLESYPRHKKNLMPKKTDDWRVIIMQKPCFE